MRLNYAAVKPLRNNIGQKILIIPSLAPGFAKLGMPTLLVTRSGYADFMKQIVSLHTSEYLLPQWWAQIATPQFPAPIYTIGSWNEEDEGHAIFPADFNLSLAEMQQRGFDLPMAIKQVFGWNHYSQRSIGQA